MIRFKPFFPVFSLILCLILSASICAPNSFALTKKLNIYEQEIRQLYRQGKKLVQRKAHKRALVKFNAALALLKQRIKANRQKTLSPKIKKRLSGFHYVIARTYHYDKQFSQAYISYQHCLASGARGRMAKLANLHAKKLQPKVLIKIKITSKPTGASLTLTNSRGVSNRYATPLKTQLPPGSYRLALRHEHYDTTFKRLWFAPKKPFEGTFILNRTRSRLVLRSIPKNATFTLKSKDATFGEQTPFSRQLPTGRYQLKLSHEGFITRTETLILQANKALVLNFRMQQTKAKQRLSETRGFSRSTSLPHPRRKVAQIVGWSSVIVALAVGSGAGAMFGLGENEMVRYNLLAGDPQNNKKTEQIRGHHANAGMYRTIGVIAVITAGTAGLLAAGMFIWNGGSSPEIPQAPTTSGKTLNLLP